jgi:hypothetical protein
MLRGMKRALAAIAVSIALWSCTPMSGAGGIAAPLPPGGAVPDEKTAIAIARKTCHPTALQRWLSPYRWSAQLHDGVWHVRVPFFDGALNCAYAEIDISAADGAAGHCDVCFRDTVVIAGAN